MIDIDDFIYPRDLQVKHVHFQKCLIIGSCMSSTTVDAWRRRQKNTKFEYIVFNNIADIGEMPPDDPTTYDFQLVQLPIRSLIGDNIIKFSEYYNVEKNEEIFDNSHNALRLMIDYALKFNKDHKILTFVQNFVVPQMTSVAGLSNLNTRLDLKYLVQSLNMLLAECLSNYENVYLIDAESIASSMGKRHFFDDSIQFFTHGGFWFEDWVELESARLEKVPPMSRISDFKLDQFIAALWRACEYNYRVVNQIDSVKLVIFDLDDTLWRGVLGEQYEYGDERPSYEGWPLGVHEAIQHLKARGILVALCSKNSSATVKERWYRAIPLQWVNMEDFVSVEIDWTPKVEGIAKIMSDVGLTPKSVLFVDDNPVERQSVLDSFPGIRVMGANPFNTRRVLLNSPETQIAVLTAESMSRDAMVRRQKERESERKALTREEFLATLNCRITLNRVSGTSDNRFPRTFELINKTNQFNTNGARWTIPSFEDYFREGGEIVTFSVEDKFTSYGLVGVLLLRGTTIGQFVMSCRVLGLDVEIGVVKRIVRDQRKRGYTGDISASIVDTSVNLPCRDVYRRSGFADVGEGIFVVPEGTDLRDFPAHLSFVWEQ